MMLAFICLFFIVDFIQTSIHFLYSINPSVGSRGGLSLSQRSSGERRGTPWTGRQSIIGPHRDKRDKQPHTLTLTPKDNLESPINLTFIFLDGGRKPEYPERTHAYTGRTCKLHTERPRWGSNLCPSRCETVQPPIHLCSAKYFYSVTLICALVWQQRSHIVAGLPPNANLI